VFGATGTSASETRKELKIGPPSLLLRITQLTLAGMQEGREFIEDSLGNERRKGRWSGTIALLRPHR